MELSCKDRNRIWEEIQKHGFFLSESSGYLALTFVFLLTIVLPSAIFCAEVKPKPRNVRGNFTLEKPTGRAAVARERKRSRLETKILEQLAKRRRRAAEVKEKEQEAARRGETELATKLARVRSALEVAPKNLIPSHKVLVNGIPSGRRTVLDGAANDHAESFKLPLRFEVSSKPTLVQRVRFLVYPGRATEPWEYEVILRSGGKAIARVKIGKGKHPGHGTHDGNARLRWVEVTCGDKPVLAEGVTVIFTGARGGGKDIVLHELAVEAIDPKRLKG